MFTLQSKWRYLVMFLGVQLVVMALLSREGYQRRVSYFFRIFRRTDHGTSAHGARNATTTGGDVYANLSVLVRTPAKEDLPLCPKKSPLIGEFSRLAKANITKVVTFLPVIHTSSSFFQGCGSVTD